MLKMAWRNLWRNRTRTTIIVLVISLSYALMLVNMGLGDAAHQKMMEAAIRSAGGNILIDGEGFWDAQSSEFVVHDPDAVTSTASQLDGVEAVMPRVIATGLVSSARGSGPLRLNGIDLEAESALVDPRRYLVQGSFFDGQVDDPLVLGSGLVDRLELELGDRVVVTATDPTGEVTRALFHLTGVLETGTEALDDIMGYTTLEAAQSALAMGGEVTQVGLLIDSDDRRGAVRDALVSRLGPRAQGLEVLTWDEAIPEMVGAVEIDDAFFYLYAVIIFVVVGFGIANTFLMSVMERIRELGLLNALGLTPTRTVRLLLGESFLLAVLSVAAGFAIGFSIHLYLATHGIDIAKLYGMDIEVAGVTMDDTLIRSAITPIKWIVGTVGVLVLILFSCLYPAWRAVRLDPAQAMRTFQ